MVRAGNGGIGATDPPPASFTDVDADAPELLAMMDATDRWPAVRAARHWVLGHLASLGAGPVVDVGCGPGTFGRAAAGAGRMTVGIDRSGAMVRAAHGRGSAVAVRADGAALPLRSRSAALVHAERMLQWSPDPEAVLAELWRVTAPAGLLAVTDTDWGRFSVAHPDEELSARVAATASRWIPHPHLAATLADGLVALGATAVTERVDLVRIDAWDPDDPAQDGGPPGLPLSTMAATGGARAAADVAALAQEARLGRFGATLTLVTAVGICPA